MSEIKGSRVFKTVLDQYLKSISYTFYPSDDFMADKFRLFSKKKFIRLFHEDYHYLPYFRRLEKLKGILQGDLKRKKKNILAKIEAYYDDRIDRAIYRGKDADKRR
ncbi:RNA polymerase recycling motor HelD, partial [Sutcliffiella horikoshii]